MKGISAVLDVGANVDVVGRTLETMLGGRLVTRFKQDGEQYDVMVDPPGNVPDGCTNPIPGVKNITEPNGR